MESFRRLHFSDEEVERGFPSSVQYFINRAFRENDNQHDENFPYIQRVDQNVETESTNLNEISIDYTLETSPYTASLGLITHDSDSEIIIDHTNVENRNLISAPIDHTADLPREIQDKYKQIKEISIKKPSKILPRFRPDSKEGWYVSQRRLERIRSEKYEKNFRQSLRRIVYGVVTTRLTLHTSHILKNKENKKQAKNGIKILNAITDIPLSETIQNIYSFLTIIVILINLGVTVYDIQDKQDPERFKVPNMFFAAFDIIFFVILKVSSKIFSSNKNWNKYSQYAENILTEILLYVLTIFLLFGFTSEKMFKFENDDDDDDDEASFRSFQIALNFIDFIQLLITYILRIFIIRKFLIGLMDAFKTDGWKFANFILLRIFINVITNTILLIFLFAFLGYQINNDNPGDGENAQYLGSLQLYLLIAATILLPLYSISMFIAVNSYWVLTVLIRLNRQAAENEEFRENLDKKLKDYGDVVNDALKFSMENATKTKEKAEEFSKVGIFHKTFYSFNDVRIMGLVIIWEGLAILPIVVYLIEDKDKNIMYFFIIYVILLAISNYHLIIVVLIINIIIFITIFSFVAYPIGTLICFNLKCKNFGLSIHPKEEESNFIEELRENEALIPTRTRKQQKNSD